MYTIRTYEYTIRIKYADNKKKKKNRRLYDKFGLYTMDIKYYISKSSYDYMCVNTKSISWN